MFKRIILYLLAFILSVILIFTIYIGLSFWRASSGLPEWDGTLIAERLDGPVEIIRDEHGRRYWVRSDVSALTIELPQGDSSTHRRIDYDARTGHDPAGRSE